jgi:hypothetical protein
MKHSRIPPPPPPKPRPVIPVHTINLHWPITTPISHSIYFQSQTKRENAAPELSTEAQPLPEFLLYVGNRL